VRRTKVVATVKVTQEESDWEEREKEAGGEGAGSLLVM